MSKTSPIAVFNSPFELGLRMVYLLCSLRPFGADLQKLVLLDYAIVYSGDLAGPSSLHTPVPYRGSELLSRRELIEQGLYIMSTRGLVDATMDDTGITYVAGPSALAMVGSLTSPYFLELEARCRWAASSFRISTRWTSRPDSQRAATSGALNLEATMAKRGHQWQLS